MASSSIETTVPNPTERFVMPLDAGLEAPDDCGLGGVVGLGGLLVPLELTELGGVEQSFTRQVLSAACFSSSLNTLFAGNVTEGFSPLPG